MGSRSTFLRQLSGLMEGRRLEGERTIRNVRGPRQGGGEASPPRNPSRGTDSIYVLVVI